MASAPDRVYRKTANGQAALANRASGLSARQRTALILVNGREPVSVLAPKIGADTVALLQALLGLGLIEDASPAVRAVAAPPPVMPAPVPAAPPPPAAPAPNEVQAILAPLKREAVRRLAPQFGPDVEVVCQALLASTTVLAYRTALDGIEAKLAIYLGKSKAKQALEGLWP